MNPKTLKYWQMTAAFLFVLVIGGLSVHNMLNRTDSQSSLDFHYHPIASVLGSLFPSLVLAPVVYWMWGKLFRRIAARFKTCEYCAETIKADAKICRYCGRGVALAAVRPEQLPNNQTGPAALLSEISRALWFCVLWIERWLAIAIVAVLA